MRSVSGPADHEASAHRPQLLASESVALTRLWAAKSDEALRKAAASLADYTEVGQAAIREELRRRSIAIPNPEGQTMDGDSSGEDGAPIYSHPDVLRVESVQGDLISHGIACEIQKLRAGPLTERSWHGLWLVDESQAGVALRFIHTLLDGSRQEVEEGESVDSEGGVDQSQRPYDGPLDGSPTWICPQCREEVEGQFAECWHCGSERSL